MHNYLCDIYKVLKYLNMTSSLGLEDVIKGKAGHITN